MNLAINYSKINSSEINYINAHGTSTPANDKLETLAIKKVFGKDSNSIPISSTKSMIGHSLGASGALEAIVCVKTINDSVIHPTINLNKIDIIYPIFIDFRHAAILYLRIAKAYKTKY